VAKKKTPVLIDTSVQTSFHETRSVDDLCSPVKIRKTDKNNNFSSELKFENKKYDNSNTIGMEFYQTNMNSIALDFSEQKKYSIEVNLF